MAFIEIMAIMLYCGAMLLFAASALSRKSNSKILIFGLVLSFCAMGAVSRIEGMEGEELTIAVVPLIASIFYDMAEIITVER